MDQGIIIVTGPPVVTGVYSTTSIQGSGYEVNYIDKTIKCLNCGMVSHNLDDIKHRYCGRCNKFHEG